MTPATAPMLSIVMPSLNQARFIRAAVRSVLTQEVGDADAVELVVADGGSSDGTQAELAALAQAFPGQLHWQSAADGGPAQAVNTAVGRSRGRWIGWLNADDLYTPGALQRLLQQLRQQPGQVMVYGHAEHVDESGAVLGPYPTRPPPLQPADFAAGCHICQPSAFFSRAAFDALGGLDENLRTAFDFEFWLRLFKAYPGRIGFVDAVQAQSRLHRQTITSRLREQVALEAMELLHRHLGHAPPHWLLTHFAELRAAHPFEAGPQALLPALRRLQAQAAHWLDAAGQARVQAEIDGHRGHHLGSGDAAARVQADVHADGWAGAQFELRVRQGDAPWPAVRVHARHAPPHDGPLTLTVHTAVIAPGWRDSPGTPPQRLHMPGGAHFVFDLALPQTPDARVVFDIRCAPTFVPAQELPGSDDTRELGVRLKHIELLRR